MFMCYAEIKPRSSQIEDANWKEHAKPRKELTETVFFHTKNVCLQKIEIQ